MGVIITKLTTKLAHSQGGGGVYSSPNPSLGMGQPVYDIKCLTH